MQRVVIITGTPGTGKTKVARYIAKKLRADYVDVNEIIKKYKLYSSYDKKLETYIVDPKRLVPVLRAIIKQSKNSIAIDGHLSHYLQKKDADLCIVTKCGIKILEERLRKRGYSRKKIQENLDSERFDVCLVDAAGQGHKIRIVDTTKGIKELNVKRLLS